MKKLQTCIAGLGLVIVMTSAQAVSVTFNLATATEVQWTITGGYQESLTSSSFSDGPWTITLDSPTPAPDPGSGEDWSLRLFLECAGLTGGRTDYHAAELVPGVGWSITVHDAFNSSGTFATAVEPFGFASLSVLSQDNWVVAGRQPINPGSVPEPATPFAGVLACVLGLLATRRLRA